MQVIQVLYTTTELASHQNVFRKMASLLTRLLDELVKKNLLFQNPDLRISGLTGQHFYTEKTSSGPI